MQDSNQLISYFKIRTAIGLIGFFLPLMCIAIEFCLGNANPIQIDLSHYYYGAAHFLFTGTLYILGALLFTYQGNKEIHPHVGKWSTIAGVLAIMTAIFPTHFQGFKTLGSASYQAHITINYPIIGNSESLVQTIHFVSAASLLFIFAVFCLRFFRDHDDIKSGGSVKKKELRNKIYVTCGFIILLSLIFAVIGMNKTVKDFFPHNLLFFEATAIMAFGVSWMVKGSVQWDKGYAFFKFWFKILRG